MKIRPYLTALAKRLLKKPVCAPVVAALIWYRLRPYHDGGSGALTVLAFNSSRWLQDLAAIARVPDLTIVLMDDSLQRRINALFDVAGVDPHPFYFLETDGRILTARRKRVDYIRLVGGWLKRFGGVHCAVTPAINYHQDVPWAEGFDRAALPFVAFHKEFTIIDGRHVKPRIAEQKPRQFRFVGSHACVTNDNARRLLCGAGVTQPDNVSVVGLPRADNLFQLNDRSGKNAEPRRSLTLFSFGHVTGPFKAPLALRSHYFSLNADVGFIELFRDVHVGFAETALQHPDVTFNIKPKNVEQWWIDEIETVLRDELDMTLDDIPNCSVVDRWAPDLMRESMATIVLNSTVVLESRILGCNTILPLFAEAAGEYSDHIYFDQYVDLFAVATSKQDLIDKLERAIRGESLLHGSDERLQQMCESYLGNSDGRSAERLVGVLRDLAAGRPDAPLRPEMRTVN